MAPTVMLLTHRQLKKNRPGKQGGRIGRQALGKYRRQQTIQKRKHVQTGNNQ